MIVSDWCFMQAILNSIWQINFLEIQNKIRTFLYHMNNRKLFQSCLMVLDLRAILEHLRIAWILRKKRPSEVIHIGLDQPNPMSFSWNWTNINESSLTFLCFLIKVSKRLYSLFLLDPMHSWCFLSNVDIDHVFHVIIFKQNWLATRGKLYSKMVFVME